MDKTPEEGDFLGDRIWMKGGEGRRWWKRRRKKQRGEQEMRWKLISLGVVRKEALRVCFDAYFCSVTSEERGCAERLEGSSHAQSAHEKVPSESASLERGRSSSWGNRDLPGNITSLSVYPATNLSPVIFYHSLQLPDIKTDSLPDLEGWHYQM